ncbi:MAG: hypothetical protein GY868_09585 [Deltaproteobacteria bacterium]|nr:hypothetical protein [Deltaproteobacteria bacterium]
MKITGLEGINQSTQQHAASKTTKSSASFENILDSTMHDTSAAGPQTDTAQHLKAVSNINITPALDRDQTIAQVEKFLDTLEEYSVSLNSSRHTLKDLSPLVTRMEHETDDLKQLSKSLPPDDEIKAIIDESLIRSSVEIIRFNRGDYI